MDPDARQPTAIVSGPTGTALPDFLGIGVQRAATTWLHRCLDQHPGIFMPKKKELFYFTENYERGLDWYREWFVGAVPGQVIGEITPSYLHDASAERIAELLPRAKLFVVLREPVGRALSAYRLFRDAQYAGQSFREACQTSDYLIRRSMYSDRLRQLLTVFPREQVRVYLYNDIKSAPEKVLEDLFTYLGVDPAFRPGDIDKIYNHVPATRIRRLLQGRIAGWLATRIKNTWLGGAVRRRLAASSDSLPADDKRYCTQLKAVFRADVLELQEILGRDLSSWL